MNSFNLCFPKFSLLVCCQRGPSQKWHGLLGLLPGLSFLHQLLILTGSVREEAREQGEQVVVDDFEHQAQQHREVALLSDNGVVANALEDLLSDRSRSVCCLAWVGSSSSSSRSLWLLANTRLGCGKCWWWIELRKKASEELLWAVSLL